MLKILINKCSYFLFGYNSNISGASFPHTQYARDTNFRHFYFFKAIPVTQSIVCKTSLENLHTLVQNEQNLLKYNIL
jgi:hypothetical protein